jgi:hypothetical protein
MRRGNLKEGADKEAGSTVRPFVLITQIDGYGVVPPGNTTLGDLAADEKGVVGQVTQPAGPHGCFAAVTGAVQRYCTGTTDTEAIIRRYCNETDLNKCGGAETAIALNDHGLLKKAFIPENQLSSLKTTQISKSMYAEGFPRGYDIYKEVRTGNPVVFGLQQESGGSLSSHALFIVGAQKLDRKTGRDAKFRFTVGDPWFHNDRAPFTVIEDFPNCWGRANQKECRSQTKLPAGYHSWFVTKVAFTKITGNGLCGNPSSSDVVCSG